MAVTQCHLKIQFYSVIHQWKSSFPEIFTLCIPKVFKAMGAVVEVIMPFVLGSWTLVSLFVDFSLFLSFFFFFFLLTFSSEGCLVSFGTWKSRKHFVKSMKVYTTYKMAIYLLVEGSGWGLAWAFGLGFTGIQFPNNFRVWSGLGSWVFTG